ncbi:MAG: hypothetical protein P0S94_02035, partial [Simkaniaceae bacterium]|nr:hypothetical protein [Simkaniaceae bacterium]
MLRISDRSLEGSYQVSHPLKFPLFLVRSEMESLLAALGQPLIAQTSKLVSEDEIYVSVEAFLDAYERYITGKMEADDRAILSSVMTKNCDALYAMQQSDGRYLVRPCLPVMQLHLFHF